MSIFAPDLYRDRLTAITPGDLDALGVKGLFLDVDNTLTRHRSQYLDPDVEIWLAEMQAAGYALTVVSNSDPRPGAALCPADRAALHLLFLQARPLRLLAGSKTAGPAAEPWRRGGRSGFHRYSGAHAAGVKSIQVMPIELETGKPLMQLKRRIEKRIIAKHKQDD